MPAVYATEKRARGLCDRCGFAFDLKRLRYDITDGRRTGLRVCGECFDIDHPQLDLGKQPIYDPQALRDPRPDNVELAAVRAQIVAIRGVATGTRVGQVTATVI